MVSDPHRILDRLGMDVTELLARVRRGVDQRLLRAADDLAHRLARVRALSPLATLERGYAVLQTTTGAVVTDPATVTRGDRVEARVALGQIVATVDETSREQRADGSDD